MEGTQYNRGRESSSQGPPLPPSRFPSFPSQAPLLPEEVPLVAI